jgi:AraC-like DNA-binding protein
MGEVLYYEILSIYFARQPQQPQHKDRKDHVFQNFIISLYQNHRMEREVTYYAQEQYLTPRYFSAIIKEKSGISALQWIIRMVIADAKQMLRSSDLSIKEIASELNFSTNPSSANISNRTSGFLRLNIETGNWSARANSRF